jgi:hypothetical protein
MRTRVVIGVKNNLSQSIFVQNPVLCLSLQINHEREKSDLLGSLRKANFR